MEDLWGTGGFLALLAKHGTGPASPEAESAMAAYRAAVPVLDGDTFMPRATGPA